MCHCKKEGRTIEINQEEYEKSRKIFSERISKQLSGEKGFWYGKHHSKESNLKRSEKLKGENNPMYGKKHSEESIIKMSKNKKGKNTGKNHPKSKKIKCIETGEIFDTATSAAKWCNLKSRSSMTICCNSEGNRTAGKHPLTGIPLHWEYVE